MSLLANISFEHPFMISNMLFILFSFDRPQTTAPRVMCITEDQLSVSLEQLMLGEGEGVILRQPNSVYEFGRSPSLIKIKVQSG